MGICSRDLNFCIRCVWAASSDSVVVGDGVGGRKRFNEFAGSVVNNLGGRGVPLTRPWTWGLMPFGLGVGSIGVGSITG